MTGGPGAPAADQTGCLYVYGIVDRDGPPPAGLEHTGVGRIAAVHRWIDAEELAGLDADVAEGSPLARLVRRHDEVLCTLAQQGAVLPVRLGTLLPDEAALQSVLALQEPHIVAALDRVRGRGEWDLRVIVRAPAEPPVLAGSGTSYLLGRRDARRASAELTSAVAALDDALARLADAHAGSSPIAPGTSMSRAYLVPHAARDAFIAAGEQGVTELERFGCSAVLRGPLPAYSFVDIRLEATVHG